MCVRQQHLVTTLQPHHFKQKNRAGDKCQREKRKTINGDDLLWALQALGFEDYIEPLQAYLSKFREAEVREISE